jgi:transcription elongation factor Elf1
MTYKRFIKLYLKLNGFKPKDMVKTSLDEENTTYFCKCGTKLQVVSLVLLFPFVEKTLKFYVAVCDKCNKAHIHSGIEIS